MNTHPEVFVSYHLIFKLNFCERMTLIPLICISMLSFAHTMPVPFLLLVWDSLRITSINYLITIISPCLEALQFIDLMYITIKQFLIIIVEILATLNNKAAGYKH